MLDVVVALVLLTLGAVLLTAGAEAFAEHVAESAAVLGLSVVAMGVLLAGAEPEEAVTALLAAVQGHPALAAGDAVGANLVVLTLTLGLAALLTQLPVTRRTVEYAAAAALAGGLAALAMRDGVVGRSEGAALVLVYVAGVAWVWWRERLPPVVGEAAEHGTAGPAGRPAPRALGLVLLGLLGMVAGGVLAVAGAEGLVGTFGATESVVGLTVLALATSAEMLALVVAAHRRGLTEVALAGALGAVGYNATVSLGLAAWAEPLLLGRDAPVLRVALVTATLPLVVLAGRRTGSLPRWLGVPLVGTYLLVTGWLLWR